MFPKERFFEDRVWRALGRDSPVGVALLRTGLGRDFLHPSRRSVWHCCGLGWGEIFSTRPDGRCGIATDWVGARFSPPVQTQRPVKLALGFFLKAWR